MTVRQNSSDPNCPASTSFSASLTHPVCSLPSLLDLVDEVLAAISINIEKWSIEELSDIVRHYDYDTGEVERYLLRKIEEESQSKHSDDLFDLDEENGTPEFDIEISLLHSRSPTTLFSAESTLTA